MRALDSYLEGFTEEPGYLDYATVAPLSRVAAAEADAFREVLGHVRPTALQALAGQHERMRVAAAAITGFRAEQIVAQPSTTDGLMQVMFGMTGGVLLSAAEYPSLPFSVVRASQALNAVTPQWLETDHGTVTPGQIRDQLTPQTAAVAVSLVDARTGYLVDLEGIRQVIGDRLLIVDAIQGIGVVDAPFQAADVVATGGRKYLRSGYGSGFLALSDRALDLLEPVLSGPAGVDSFEDAWDAVPEPSVLANAYRVANPDHVACARLAASLEELALIGIQAVAAEVRDKVASVIDLADEYGVPVLSSRHASERAAIVVLGPQDGQLTALTAALHNHGVQATVRQGLVRLSVHAGTTAETLGLLRAALLEYSLAVRPLH